MDNVVTNDAEENCCFCGEQRHTLEDLVNIQRGKYFRLVADVWIDDKRLADKLISAGLAKEYYGKTKTKWRN